MLRSFLVAALAALSISSFTPAAKADVDVRLYLGGPSYSDDCFWSGGRYRCFGGPMLRPHHHKRHFYSDDYGYYQNYGSRRLSCNSAAKQIRNRGFNAVTAVDCQGKTYGFKARKHGKRYFISVNSRTGNMSVSRR